MAETSQPLAPEFQTAVSAVKDAPFGAGESAMDRTAKIEALYKAQYAPLAQPGPEPKAGESAEPTPQQEAQPQPVEINWADAEGAEVPPEVAGVRQELASYFGELGVTSQQANGLIGIARRYRGTPLTDAEAFDKQRASEEVLRAEWRPDFEANARAIRQVIKVFEKRISHADLDTAIENGMWLDPDVNRALLEVARRQDPITVRTICRRSGRN